MTDAELLGLAQAEIGLIQGGVEWGLTILTGYLLIAYVIGKNLSVFQVSFVNGVFAVLVFGAAGSSISSSVVVRSLLDLLYEQSPDLALQVGYERVHSLEAVWLTPITTAVIALGALAFMWSVRHPKTE
jgi:hypothetical protein